MAEIKTIADRITKHLHETKPIVAGVDLLKDAHKVIEEQKALIDQLMQETALSALLKAQQAMKNEIDPNYKFYHGLNAYCDGCPRFALDKKWKIKNDKLFVEDHEGLLLYENGDLCQRKTGTSIVLVSVITDEHRERLEYVLDRAREITVSDSDSENDSQNDSENDDENDGIKNKRKSEKLDEEPSAKRQHLE